MGMNELYPIEVVLTYMDDHPVMLVKTAPTGDYDSATEANAWVNRVTTGNRCLAIAMTPINGQGAAAHEDAEVKPEARCPMDNCVMGPEHDGPHQDKAGETWDQVDVLGVRENVAKREIDLRGGKPGVGREPAEGSRPS